MADAPADDVTIEVLPLQMLDIDETGSTEGVRLACRLVPLSGDVIYDEDAFDASNQAELVADSVPEVRPYVRVGGRAVATYHLEFETLVTATGMHLLWAGSRELTEDQHTLCLCCETPRSVAEIAAALDVPIGVAQVLISDAIERGLVEENENAVSDVGRPSLELLKRVHAGIAKLA
jgi:hypothetical protein